MKIKVIVADKISERGFALLRETGWDILAPAPAALPSEIANADGLIVRSATKVTAQLLEAAQRLRVVGRAGVGVDNIDVEAATHRGVLVMNTPGGNSVSVAEHTFALMLALARSVPQSNASIHAGRWEKSSASGTELRGKTLGLIGFGRVGTEVARRARALEMDVVAHDPYVTPAAARELEVELVPLDDLLRRSDFVSLHTSLSPSTEKMIGAATLAKMKRGARLINCARGELIDQDALREAMASGKVAGAALDVFEKEPPAADDPLLAMENFVATPHIGGSTEEAQETVGVRIAEQIVEYLQNGAALHAVNLPALTPEQYKALAPYSKLAERLGTFATYISQGNPQTVRITYFGKIAEYNTHLLRNAGLAGVLQRSMAGKANSINAMQIAGDRGLTVAERHDKRATHTDSIRLELETDAGVTSVEGAVVLDGPRLLQVNGIACEAALEGSLTYLQNEDVPGVIGYIGAALGKSGINIATFSLGRRSAGAEAVSVIQTDQPVPDPVIAELLKNPAVKLARPVKLAT